MATKKPPKAQTVQVPEISYPQDETRSYDFYEPKPLAVAPSVDYAQGTTRDQIIDTLEAYQMPQLEKRSQLLDQYLAKDSTDWTDVLSEALLTIGPMIAGYAMDGNTGGVYGSQIGLNAGNTYRQQARADRELERYKTGQQLQQLDAEISAGEAMRQKYLDKGLDFGEQRMLKADDREYQEARYDKTRQDHLDDEMTLMQMRKKFGGGPESADLDIPDAMIEEMAQRAGKTPEQVRQTIPKKRADAYAAIQLGDFIGGRPKAISDATTDQLEAGYQSKYLISEMRKDAALMAQDPQLLNAIRAGKLAAAYRVPGTPAERFYKNALQLQKQIARQNDGGRPTDKDFEVLAPIVMGAPLLDTPDSIIARLNDLDSYSDFKLKTILDLQKATGRRTANLEKMMNGEGAFPTNSSGNDWLNRAEQGQLPVSSNVPLKTYTVDELQRRGYSAAEIADLRSKGKVR